MELTRELYYGLSGPDVFAMKELLLKAGLYAPHIQSVARERFGSDTLHAVCALQERSGLIPNGVVNEATWRALKETAAAAEQATEAVSGAGADLPENIGQAAAASIRADLAGASEKARAVTLDALQFAFDPAVPREYPISLYIRGGNLYNKDLKRNVITLARIASGASAQPEYYDGGRREMMEAAVEKYPDTTGADCSGGIVGLLRHNGCVESGFDTTADGFRRSGRMRSIGAEELLPGDLVHKSGHIGLYAGGGYVVEWMGGAYGCQLTKRTARKGYNFLTRRTGAMGQWTSFLRPSYYGERM